jgi:hypothetical protein
MTTRTKVALAACLLVGIVFWVIFGWHRFLDDFWPIDASRIAPNIVAGAVQWAIILIAAALLYPPIRRAIDAYVTGHVQSLKAHVSAEHDALHEKLDHLIRHSNVPDFEPTSIRPTPSPKHDKSLG